MKYIYTFLIGILFSVSFSFVFADIKSIFSPTFTQTYTTATSTPDIINSKFQDLVIQKLDYLMKHQK